MEEVDAVSQKSPRIDEVESLEPNPDDETSSLHQGYEVVYEEFLVIDKKDEVQPSFAGNLSPSELARQRSNYSVTEPESPTLADEFGKALAESGDSVIELMSGAPVEDSKTQEPGDMNFNVPDENLNMMEDEPSSSTIQSLDYRKILLNAIKNHSIPSSFAFGGEISSSIDNPIVFAEGVGRLKEPVTLKQIMNLISNARPVILSSTTASTSTASDIHNTKIWYVDASKIVLNKTWNNRTIPKLLLSACVHFGINETGTSAIFRRLIIYESGAHFINQRELRDDTGYFGSLYFQITSSFEDGQISISHDGISRSFDFSHLSAESLYFLAFLKDSDYTLSPITKGYRMMLEYDLICEATNHPITPSASNAHQLMIDVDTAVNAWENDSKGPQKFFVKLGNDYKPAQFTPNHLKGADKRTTQRLVQFQSTSNQQLFQVHLAMLCKTVTWAYQGNSRQVDMIRYHADEWAATDLRATNLTGTLAVDFPNDILTDQPVESDAIFYNRYTMRPSTTPGQYGQFVDYIYRTPCLVFWPSSHNFQILVETNITIAIDLLKANASVLSPERYQQHLNYLLDYATSHVMEVWGDHFNNKNITGALISLCDTADRVLQILRICSNPHLKRYSRTPTYIGITDLFSAGAISNAIKTYSWNVLGNDVKKVLHVSSPVNITGACAVVEDLVSLNISDCEYLVKFLSELILRYDISVLPIIDFRHTFRFMLKHASSEDFQDYLKKIEEQAIPYSINHILDSVDFTGHENALSALRQLMIRKYTGNRPDQRISCEDFLTFVDSLIRAGDSASLGLLSQAIMCSQVFNDSVLRLMFQRDLVVKAIRDHEEPNLRRLCQWRFDRLASCPRPNPSHTFMMSSAMFPAPVIQGFLRGPDQFMSFKGEFRSLSDATAWIISNFHIETPMVSQNPPRSVSSISMEEMLSRGYSATAEVHYNNGQFYIDVNKTIAWFERLMHLYEIAVKECLHLKLLLSAQPAAADVAIGSEGMDIETPQKRSRVDDVNRGLSVEPSSANRISRGGASRVNIIAPDDAYPQQESHPIRSYTDAIAPDYESSSDRLKL